MPEVLPYIISTRLSRRGRQWTDTVMWNVHARIRCVWPTEKAPRRVVELDRIVGYVYRRRSSDDWQSVYTFPIASDGSSDISGPAEPVATVRTREAAVDALVVFVGRRLVAAPELAHP